MNLVIAAAQFISVPGDVSQNVAHRLRFGRLAAEHGVQLVVFPELSLTGYEPSIARSAAIRQDSSHLDSLRDLAEDAHMTLIAGGPVLTDKGELYIAALTIAPTGSVSIYAKEHLHLGEEEVFTPGPGGAPFRIGDATVALAICADITHPEHAAGAAARGANLYAAGVAITENGYAPDTELLRTCAKEHKMAILMANYGRTTGAWVSAGRSAIWSEEGDIVAASGGTEEALIVSTKQGGMWQGVALSI